MLELFAYPQVPLRALERTGIHSNPFYTISQISFESPVSGIVPGYFVEPAGLGPFPTILFLHPAIHTKDYFLDDARSLAKKGVASLLIDAPMARPDPWKQVGSMAEPELERDLYIQTVIDLRRAIDFLESERCVDTKRLGFVGQNYGASLGAILAAVDKRIAAYVLIAGIPNLSQFWQRSTRPIAMEARETLTPQQIDAYVDATREFAAVNFIGKAAPAALFFQFAKQDNWITKAMAFQFYDAASSPKKIRFYENDSRFEAPEPHNEYMEWIRNRLTPPPPTPAEGSPAAITSRI